MDEIFQEAAKEEARSAKPVIISRLEDLYRESRARGDRKTALADLKELRGLKWLPYNTRRYYQYYSQ